jgi:hypothetical protein
MSKSSSPQGCIWHVDQVSQTPGRVGKGDGRLARVWDSSAWVLVATRLHEEEKPESVEKVGGGHSTRSAGYVAWLAGHHLASNRPLQVGGGPIHPYKYPPHGESRDTTLYLYFSTYKGSVIVVVVQAKPYRESRVESSLRSSSGSSLRDWWALVSLPFFIDFES